MHHAAPLRAIPGLTALALALTACPGPEITGTPDAGAEDSGLTADAGFPPDSGETDAGFEDAGPPPLAPAFEALSGTAPSTPAGRWGAWLVHAPARHALYQFGGSHYPTSNASSAQAWSYDLESQSWSELSTSGDVPAARYCLCATYLPDQDEILFVGGRNAQGPLPVGAWTLDLETLAWTAVTDGDIPPGVVGCHAAWFPPGGYALVFGGDGYSGLQRQSYTYDPVSRAFAKLDVANPPIARRDGMMAYDPVSAQVVLHGGAGRIGPGGAHYNDTWVFDGADWAELTTTGGPPPERRWGAFGVDPARHRFVLFSGTQETEDHQDLWTLDLDAGAWTQHQDVTLPTARAGASHAFVPEEDALYFFGGLTQPDYRALTDGWRIKLGG